GGVYLDEPTSPAPSKDASHSEEWLWVAVHTGAQTRRYPFETLTDALPPRHPLADEGGGARRPSRWITPFARRPEVTRPCPRAGPSRAPRWGCARYGRA